ncbi:MAG: hypothetical protein HYY16_19835 [Planctomycetes bacterium]|nr:hypothetical protein [Planctomycetota bacterium]
MPIPGMDALVERLVSARAANPAPIESREDLVELIEDMDLLYWNEVELVLAEAARRGPHRLQFGRNDRLLLDAGVVDARLLEGGPTARIALLRELYSPPDPRTAYFTEWIEARYRHFLATGGMEDEAGDREMSISAARRAAYESLAATANTLAAFPPQAIEMLLSGKLDAGIEELAERTEEPLAEKRRRLTDIRSSILGAIRARAVPGEQAALDTLARLDEAASRGAKTIPQEAPRLTSADRVRFVMGELRMVRSVVKLGIAGSGLVRTHSVLVAGEERMTRPDLASVAATVRQCDSYFRRLHFMIAPYVGTGFYSFDRDVLFVPLISTRSKEDSAVNAVAQYRILLDGLNENGTLKRAYEQRFGKRDFRGEFTRDYKAWVLGVGRGFRGALDSEHYDFFKALVGPQPRELFATAELARLSPEEHSAALRAARERMARDEAATDDHYRLAVAFHRDGRAPEALEQLEQASRLSPLDGRLLYAQGYVLAQAGLRDRARPILEECAVLAQGTIWYVYATDELQKL